MMIVIKHIYDFKIIYLFICFGCTGSQLLFTGFLYGGEQALLLIVVHGLLTAVASLIMEHRLQDLQDSVIVLHRLSCLVACGIFPE